MKQNRFIIIRKCDIAKCGPSEITKLKKCKHEKQILSTMILIITRDLILERSYSTSILYVSCKKAFLAFCFHKFFFSS